MTESGDGVEEAPKIEFPCLYPIKIIGESVEGFQTTVIEIVERHTGDLDASLIDIKASGQNNYLSVRVTIAATGEEQLRNLFEDLKALESVRLVL